ncbi:YdcF family protein [Marinagarivorans algicola]|uniref:YdcF family protein n=1 Tax=Marinagarivorans algicola TaxID=1513270 RepID=UPI0006B4F6E7|nr:YdcF family protein [Marinagarivorans algicola]
MKVLAVLAHLMSSDCVLDDESIARAELAIHKFKQYVYPLIVTSGWAYRSDCSTPIADVLANYISSHSIIPSHKIIADTRARDTVGDAYFLRKLAHERNFTEITVITSDYHVNRSTVIFKKIFCNTATIKVLGAKTCHTHDSKIMSHEQQSVQAFENTFKDTDFHQLESIYQVMVTKHPYYNGDRFDKIRF